VPYVISSNKCKNVLRDNLFDPLQSKCFDVSERIMNFHGVGLNSINLRHPDALRQVSIQKMVDVSRTGRPVM
jgi:hypothetical protein